MAAQAVARGLFLCIPPQGDCFPGFSEVLNYPCLKMRGINSPDTILIARLAADHPFSCLRVIFFITRTEFSFIGLINALMMVF